MNTANLISPKVYVGGKPGAMTVRTEGPRFSKAHVQTFHYFGSSKEHKQKVPDQVHIFNSAFDVNAIEEIKPHKSGNTALVMRDVDANTYLAKAEEILRLQRELRAFVQEAAARARKVCKSDCINLQ